MAKPELHSHQADQKELLAEVERLRQAVARLEQENSDLRIALLNTAEHGDMIEAQLHESNQRLQSEITERERAQVTLQQILEQVTRDKEDLEIILQATAEHGDMVEYQFYTQAVETMRQSEELFRAISESTPILMILSQRFDGSITYANSISSKRFGVEAQDLIGRTLQDFFVDPDDEQALLDLLIQHGMVINHEMQVQGVEGEPFWVSASIHPLQISGQQVLLTTLYDISDRKQAEAALRESEACLQRQAQELEERVEQRTFELQQAEAKYRSIYENAAEGLFQTTLDGHYLSANPALAKLYGYDAPEELIASITDISDQIYVQPRRRDELLAYLRAFGSLSGFESQVRRKDGSIIWISESMRSVCDRNGEVVYYEGCAWDITERKETEAELRQQQVISERLLLNVLPQPIAERLKRNNTTIADHFPSATVLFADLVDFTELAAQTSPVELVDLLNSIFSAFDQLAEDHHLEKIKTIGDAYMLVGGVPTLMVSHLEAIADVAIALMQTIKTFRTPCQKPLNLRIGIHTGPVVAGVIGTSKFIYDLWGDTVNVASRMESLGKPGRIQVTAEVYNRLKHRYQFEERGDVEVKGKGKMMTYWLLDRFCG
jgi:PAS domain S-box-containing protein